MTSPQQLINKLIDSINLTWLFSGVSLVACFLIFRHMTAVPSSGKSAKQSSSRTKRSTISKQIKQTASSSLDEQQTKPQAKKQSASYTNSNKHAAKNSDNKKEKAESKERPAKSKKTSASESAPAKTASKKKQSLTNLVPSKEAKAAKQANSTKSKNNDDAGWVTVSTKRKLRAPKEKGLSELGKEAEQQSSVGGRGGLKRTLKPNRV